MANSAARHACCTLGVRTSETDSPTVIRHWTGVFSQELHLASWFFRAWMLPKTAPHRAHVRLAGSGPRHCSSCRGRFDKDMFSPNKLHVPCRNRHGGRNATAGRAGHTRVLRRFSFRQYWPTCLTPIETHRQFLRVRHRMLLNIVRRTPDSQTDLSVHLSP